MATTSITVQQILERKGNRIYAVGADSTVFEALELMAEADIGGVLVIDDGVLKGIFTERDYARKIVLKGLVSRNVKVGQMMTANPVTVPPTAPLNGVMQTMTRRRFRHLPVVDGDTVVGVVTIGDVLKAVLEDHETTIQHLSDYIAGDIATGPTH